jgi:hypothetical protein
MSIDTGVEAQIDQTQLFLALMGAEGKSSVMGQVLLSKFIGLPRDVVLSQIKP